MSEIPVVIDLLKHFRDNVLCFAIILKTTFRNCQRSRLLLIFWNTLQRMYYALQLFLMLVARDSVCCWCPETLSRQFTMLYNYPWCYVSRLSEILFVVDVLKHFRDRALCFAIILDVMFKDCQRFCLLLIFWNTFQTLYYALQLFLMLRLRIVRDPVCCWCSEILFRQCFEGYKFYDFAVWAVQLTCINSASRIKESNQIFNILVYLNSRIFHIKISAFDHDKNKFILIFV